jgi:hypothetical protein
MRRGVQYLMLAMALATGSGRSRLACGHGPMFGMAPPTNLKDGWSLDTGLMGQKRSNATAVMSRAMLGYGITSATWHSGYGSASPEASVSLRSPNFSIR